MKFSEVIKALEENHEKVFECNFYNKTARISVDYGWFHVKFYDKKGKLLDECKPGGKFNDNLNLNYEWQEVKQPVPWKEALEAWANGKTVFCFLENGKRVEYDQNINFIHAHSLKTGTWYIED